MRSMKMDKAKKEVTKPREKKMLNVFIDSDLFKKMKIKVAKEDTTISQVISDAVIAYCKN